MPDISLLADRAAAFRRRENLAIPGAVWRALRIAGLGNNPDARNIHRDVCAELQRRAVARRKKNIRLGVKSRRIPEQGELCLDPADALRVIAERGGDPDD